MSMKSKRNKSWVWAYFTPCSEMSATCDICETEIQRVNAGTSAMSNHLIRKHSLSESSIIKEKSRKSSTSDEDLQLLDDTDPLTSTRKAQIKLKRRECPTSSQKRKTLQRRKASTDDDDEDQIGMNFFDNRSFSESTARNKKTSWVWNYFTIRSEKSASCNICKAEIQRGNLGTSAMSNHLTRKHSLSNSTVNQLNGQKVSEDEQDKGSLKIRSIFTLASTNETQTKLRKRKCPATFESPSQNEILDKVLFNS